MKVIIATGTPGTGKTTVARKLARKLGFVYIDVSKIITKKRLSEGFDRKRKSKIIDVNRLNHALVNELKLLAKKHKSKKKIKGVIIDSHLSHHLPSWHVDLCIVTRCEIKELHKRLKKKKFHEEKIKENLQAEIFSICHDEAKQLKHKIVVLDTTKGFNINKFSRLLLKT